MKLLLGILYLFAVACFFRMGVAQAQSAPPAPPALWEPKAFSLGVGAGYEARIPEVGETSQGPTAIAYIARPLNKAAFVVRGSWRLDEGDVRVSPGIHYRFPVAKEHFALALSYDFYAVNNVPSPANEWSAGLLYARGLGRSLVLGASVSYGLDTHDFRPVAQLTFPLHTGRN